MKLIKSEINGYYSESDPGEPGRNLPRLSVNDIEARFVSEFMHGRTVIEIGTGLGVSTREIAKMARKVYTVDIDPWVYTNVAPTLPKNVIFCSTIWDVPEGMDAAFIDGRHEYKYAKADIAECKKRVKKGGLLILHDLAIRDIEYAIKNSGITVIPCMTYAGIGIAWND